MIRTILLALGALLIQSSGAIASARLILGWSYVEIVTSMNDKVVVRNYENSILVSIIIDDKLFIVDRNLPENDSVLPGGVSIETDSVETENGTFQIWRIIVLDYIDMRTEQRQQIEYHISPVQGLCAYKAYNERGSLLRFEEYCNN
jgi:hypothetical protein